MQCECHAEAMQWHTDRRHSEGGYWRCVVKHREAQHQRQRERTAWIAELKGDTCSECGDTFASERLHFHHVDPSTKLFNIACAWGRSCEAILAEIAKCVVVCVSCHSKIEPRGVVNV